MKTLAIILLAINSVFAQVNYGSLYAKYVVEKENNIATKILSENTAINLVGENEIKGFECFVGCGMDQYTYFYTDKTDSVLINGVYKYMEINDANGDIYVKDGVPYKNINTTEFYFINGNDTLKMFSNLVDKALNINGHYVTKFDVYTNELEKLNVLLKSNETKFIILINNKFVNKFDIASNN